MKLLLLMASIAYLSALSGVEPQGPTEKNLDEAIRSLENNILEGMVQIEELLDESNDAIKSADSKACKRIDDSLRRLVVVLKKKAQDLGSLVEKLEAFKRLVGKLKADRSFNAKIEGEGGRTMLDYTSILLVTIKNVEAPPKSDGAVKRVEALIEMVDVVGLAAAKYTLLGKALPNRRQSGIRRGALIKTDCAIKEVGELLNGNTYWVAIGPRVSKDLIPLLIGASGTPAIMAAEKVSCGQRKARPK